MMTITKIILCALILFCHNLNGTFAQIQQKTHFFCGHDILLESNALDFPGYKEVVAKTFADAKLRAQLGKERRTADMVYKVPVVIHIVWKNPEENLHDSVIQNQIDRLNKDFRKLNEDAHFLREQFQDRQADALIEFDLVEIKRVQTTVNFTPILIILPDQVKRSSQGGSDAADPSKYMNIWICKIQPIPFIGGQIFGYAYPPAALPNWPEGVSAPTPEVDGVVVDFRCIGSNNPNPMVVSGFGTIPQNGRTLVHEVGHYLGLRHIWGDGGGIFGGSSCDVDDGVEDTPNQGQSSNYDCDVTQNSCLEDPDLDLIENYMDYSAQDCQNTFTHGQVSIMRAVLEGPRAELLSSSSSIAQQSGSYELKIYPNPVDQILLISFHSNHMNSINTPIEIFDFSGKIIVKEYLNFNYGQSFNIDFSAYHPGIYFLKYGSEFHKVIKYGQ